MWLATIISTTLALHLCTAHAVTTGRGMWQPMRAHARRAMLGMTNEDEAKRAWLARQSDTKHCQVAAGGNAASNDVIRERQAEREQARKRIMKLMNQAGSEALARGRGTAFGFGMPDDESYGIRPQPPKGPALEIDPVSGKPVDDDTLRGDGFGGRQGNWNRKAETSDPNPPKMPNTLRDTQYSQIHEAGQPTPQSEPTP